MVSAACARVRALANAEFRGERLVPFLETSVAACALREAAAYRHEGRSRRQLGAGSVTSPHRTSRGASAPPPRVGPAEKHEGENVEQRASDAMAELAQTLYPLLS